MYYKKSIFSFLLGLAFLLSACGSPTGNLSGKLTNVASDSLVVRYFPASSEGAKMSMKVIPVDKGQFVTNIPDSTLQFIYIDKKPKEGEKLKYIGLSPIIYLPGDKLVITGDLDNDYTVSGSEYYTQYNKVRDSIESNEKALSRLLEKSDKLYQDNASDSAVNKVEEEILVLQMKINSLMAKYIKDNPDNILSGYFFVTLPDSLVGTLYDGLTDQLKKGPFGPIINQVYNNYKNNIVKKKAEAFLQPGNPAPDFTLNGLDGKPFTLSSLKDKGKYIVLDFWGTWCGWCIKGIPDMKKYYEKYKSKLEIVSVDCGDTEDQWKKGVDTHKLPWINVYNGDKNQIPNLYAIKGFPTKVILDPKGNIVKIVVGELPEFYSTLDQLLK